MKMKTVTALAVASLALAACGQRIGFDEAAVEVIELGGKAGVQEAEVPTGRYFKLPWDMRYIVKFPTTQQTYRWDQGVGFQFINGDRVETGQRIAMVVRINPADADNIVRKYRGAIGRNGGKDGYVLDDVVNGPIMRELQQAFVVNGTKYTSAQLYADGGQALLKDVRQTVAPKFAEDGIVIEALLSAGPPILPEDIVSTIKGSLLAVENAKRKDAELAATIAEGKKTVAQAEAEAQARRLAAESIRANPEILKLEELKVHKGICPLNANVCVVGGNALTQVGG